MILVQPAEGADPVEFGKRMNDKVRKLDFAIAQAYLKWRVRRSRAPASRRAGSQTGDSAAAHLSHPRP